jgi:hypothetical protein
MRDTDLPFQRYIYSASTTILLGGGISDGWMQSVRSTRPTVG